MLGIYKTTLNFDPDLYFYVKEQALKERKTVTEYVAEALREKTGRKKKRVIELPEGFRLGKFKSDFSREELYDFV